MNYQPQPQAVPPYPYPVQQPYPPQSCPLCGNTKHMGRKAKLLYKQWVCKKCNSGFANRRQFAFFIDWLLLNAATVVLVLGAGIHNRLETNLIALIATLIFFFKDGFTGTSPGKALMGVQAINIQTGRPADFGASFMRNLPLLIPFMVIIVGFSLIKGQRIGDGWAKTRVIWKKYADRMPFASLFPPPPVI